MPEHTPAPTPARSLYGFFMYLFSNTVLGIYCIWAIAPDEYLHKLNIYYFPQKYWATAIPIQCLVALTLFAFLIYPSSNMILTAHIDATNTIVDPFSLHKSMIKINNKCEEALSCICLDASKCNIVTYNSMPKCEETSVPLLYDLNIRYVSKKLYFNKKI